MNGRSILYCYMFLRITLLELSCVLFTRPIQQLHKMFFPEFNDHVCPVTYCLVGDWDDYSFRFTLWNVLDFLLKDPQLWRIDLVLSVKKDGQYIK